MKDRCVDRECFEGKGVKGNETSKTIEHRYDCIISFLNGGASLDNGINIYLFV